MEKLLEAQSQSCAQRRWSAAGASHCTPPEAAVSVVATGRRVLDGGTVFFRRWSIEELSLASISKFRIAIRLNNYRIRFDSLVWAIRNCVDRDIVVLRRASIYPRSSMTM